MRSWTFGGEPVGELEKIHAPGLVAIADIARHLNIQPAQVLRTAVFRSDAKGPALSSGVNPAWIVAVVRGDHELDEEKLAAAAREHFHVGIVPAGDDPSMAEKWAIGYLGPDAAMKTPDAVLIVDPDAAQEGLWAAGGNERDTYVRNFNWFRECGDRLADPRKTVVAEISRAAV